MHNDAVLEMFQQTNWTGMSNTKLFSNSNWLTVWISYYFLASPWILNAVRQLLLIGRNQNVLCIDKNGCGNMLINRMMAEHQCRDGLL